MVRKRGFDNVYERSDKRLKSSTPIQLTSNPSETKNALNDGLLNLYKQEINTIKAAASSRNDVDTSENTLTEKPNKNVEDPKTPSLSTKKTKKSNSNKALTLKYSSTNFDDVGGMDDVLKAITRLFVYFKVPLVYEELKVSPTKGILLQGPPGCGKTHLAHAIAGEFELPIIEIAATEFVCGISGESENKIRDIFDEAVKIGRCILFIDEIDAVTTKRENANSGLEKRMVTQLLKCFDELTAKNSLSNVMVIGATNIPDSIDPALRRGGRFGREFCIGIPNEECRFKILQVLSKGLKLEPDFDLSWIAHHTPGFVGADLESLVEKAVEVGLWRMFDQLGKSEDVKCSSLSDVSVDEVRAWYRSFSVSEEERENLFFILKDFQVALQDCIPYCKREGFASVPDVNWEDIGALEDVKRELRSAILRPVKFAKFYKDNGITSEKGILLYGPKGCGKTLLAKAIANECNINFLCVNGAELLSMYLGESERAVRRCFQRARDSEPCVIFFDEFDALCPCRSKSTTNAAADRVVNQMLTEMDGVQERKQVFVIAATNRIEKIDSAMLRPGRLENIIYVDLPTPEGRRDILKSLTKNKTCPKIAENCCLERIAFDKRCEDFSGADLAHLVRKAFSSAMDEMEMDDFSPSSSLMVNINHFDKALQVVKPSLSASDRKYFETHRLHRSGS